MDANIGPQPFPPSDPPLAKVWNDVLELLPDAVFIVSGGEDRGTIRYVNSQAGRMFGYEPGELIDESIDLLVPATTRQDHRQHRGDYMSAPSLRPMGVGLTLNGRRRDGSEFPIDVLLKPVHDSSGIVAVVRDMTEHKRLEDTLTQARDSALRANEVKSRFLAAASHDLRQPLQTIWSLQALLSRVHANTEYAPQCALLEDAVRSMDQMLSSLIDINRLEKGAIQPVIRDFPLEEILPRLRSEFGYAASAKSLILNIEDSTEFARSDPMLLPVIIRNLLGNAIKYTQRGSVRLRVRCDASRLFIDISDTGPGIPKEHLERLFDAFYQVDNQSRGQERGIGLGLSIVQTICRLLDHTVSVESELGQGSTFTLHLPRGLGADQPLEHAISPVLNAPPQSGSATVLHIEDDPGVALSMAMLLQLEGYKVVTAATRDEALQHIEVHGIRPDLVLCDFNLPMGFTGDQIITEIAIALGYKPPTIMLTGDIAERHVARAKLVAERILPKPADINRLLREIENLLSTRHSSADSG